MADYSCPKCESQQMIEMKTSDHVTLDFCEGCNGLWFDQHELADYLGLTQDLVDFANVKSQATSTGLKCPKCRQALLEMPFSSGSDLLIDRCEGCGGTFFDFREVAQAQSLAADLEPSDVRLKIIQQRFFQKGFGT